MSDANPFDALAKQTLRDSTPTRPTPATGSAAPKRDSNPFDSLAKASKQSNPAIFSGRTGGVTPTAKQAQSKDETANAPVYTGLSNILAVPNTPGAMLGATLRDVARGRKVGGDQPRGTNTAQSHFLEGLGKSPAAAVNEYFATSPESMKQYAKGSGPLSAIGSYFVKHPRQGAALDFVGRILDPGNALTFEGVGGIGDLLKGGTRTAARAAAKAVIKHAPEAAAHPLVRTLQSAENLGTGNRFGEVRSAAEDVARGKGWHAQQVTAHGDAAELASRNLANSGTYAKGIAQRASNAVFKGLTKDEQFEVVHMIEGDSPLVGNEAKLSPAQLKVRDKLLPRVTTYRQWRSRLDAGTQKYNVADSGRLLSGDNFFSRAGMFVDPENTLNEEELPQNEAFRKAFGGGGGTGPRKGSLGQNVHRTFPTLKAALRHGVQLRPDVDPMKAFEMHAYARTQAARMNEQLDKLTETGLIVPKEADVPFAVGVKTPNPRPPGYLDFSELGSMRSFGSNITRDAYVHPAIPSLIEDIASTHQTRKGLSSLLSLASNAGRVANHVLSAAEVSNPLYHPAFNISENVASETPSIGGLIKGATSGKAVDAAEEQGVHLPFARRQPAHQWGRPWSDLSAKEKAMRVLRSVPHGVESFSAAPLYGHVEPRMATGAYEGLKGRLGAPGAAISVRSMLGEPENIGADFHGASQVFQFPAWTLSQLRRWPAAIAKRPQLYNAPHAAISDIDATAGRSQRQSDEAKIFPPIVLGRDKNGDFNVLNIPHPGNRASALGVALLKGSPVDIGFALAGGVNPLLSQPTHSVLESLSGQQQRDLNYVAPQRSGLQKALDYVKGFGYYSPIRSFTTKELSPERAATRRQLINAFLYGHGGEHRVRGLVEIRAAQHRAEQSSDTGAADQLRKAGDDMYQRMLQELSAQSFPAP